MHIDIAICSLGICDWTVTSKVTFCCEGPPPSPLISQFPCHRLYKRGKLTVVLNLHTKKKKKKDFHALRCETEGNYVFDTYPLSGHHQRNCRVHYRWQLSCNNVINLFQIKSIDIIFAFKETSLGLFSYMLL